jgi:hypothetical protein
VWSQQAKGRRRLIHAEVTHGHCPGCNGNMDNMDNMVTSRFVAYLQIDVLSFSTALHWRRFWTWQCQWRMRDHRLRQ